MKKKFLLTVCSVIALCSCSNNELPNDVNSTKENQLKISATINSVSETRAEKSDWENGDKLGIYVCNGALGTPYKSDAVYTNSQFTYGTGGWTSASILLDENEATIFAYYPYSPTITDPTAVPVDVTTQNDYLFGSGASKATVTNRNVNINMKHALSQVVFKIKKSKDYSGEGKLTGIVLSNVGTGKNLCKNATMNVSTGALVTSNPGNIEFTATNTLSETAISLSSIVIPVDATTEENMKVVFTIDGKQLQYTFPTGTKWERAYRNIYSISLGNNGLTIGGADGSGVTIEPWTSKDPSIDIQLVPVI